MTSALAGLTSPGSALGTVAYMSPEQVRAEEVDARTDLFSFGVVLYEMATGVTTVSGRESGLIFDGILNRAPAPAGQLNPDLPRELERILARCLEKDRELRYQHASEIRADLQRLKRDLESGQPQAASQPLPVASARWKPWASAAAVVAIAAVAARSIRSLRRSPTRTRSFSATSPTRPAIQCSTIRCGKVSRFSCSSRPSSASFPTNASEERCH